MNLIWLITWTWQDWLGGAIAAALTAGGAVAMAKASP